MSTNDAWVRDAGPTFVVDDAGELRAVSWRFNAWGGLRGGLYFPWDADDLVGPEVLRPRAGATATAPDSCSRAAPSTSTARARC